VAKIAKNGPFRHIRDMFRMKIEKRPVWVLIFSEIRRKKIRLLTKIYCSRLTSFIGWFYMRSCKFAAKILHEIMKDDIIM
jgi:hypothetical protein